MMIAGKEGLSIDNPTPSHWQIETGKKARDASVEHRLRGDARGIAGGIGNDSLRKKWSKSLIR
jgi:hypothetical protein